ncbi:Barstar (barnase inhibitor) [compost metagenome]
MKFKKLSVDFRQVNTLDEMHDVLAKVFDFPVFYGKNINALIDCWSSLRFPEDEMSGITVGKDELVLLEVKGMHHLDQIMMNHLIIAVEDVNKRSMEKIEQQPLILLLPV